MDPLAIFGDPATWLTGTGAGGVGVIAWRCFRAILRVLDEIRDELHGIRQDAAVAATHAQAVDEKVAAHDDRIARLETARMNLGSGVAR